MVAVLNATASDIWRLLDGTQTIEAIVDTLATAYGADRSIVAVDVEHAIHTLRSDGYLPA
jgi:GAF domain-containing protein